MKAFKRIIHSAAAVLAVAILFQIGWELISTGDLSLSGGPHRLSTARALMVIAVFATWLTSATIALIDELRAQP